VSLFCWLSLTAAAADVLVIGRVTDENNVGVGAVRVSFSGIKGQAAQINTGPGGEFKVRLPAAGRWRVDANHEGFFPLANQDVEVRGAPQQLHLVLNRWSELHQTVQVSATPAAIDLSQTAGQKTLKRSNLVMIPFTGRDLRGAMKLMPGVVQDPREGLHFAGSSPNQVLYTLDGFNITDPLTGRFAARLNVDSVRSVEYSSGRFSPEFGKGSGGTVAISTNAGVDRLRYSATNFVPGLDMRSGVHIGTWAPRMGISGPLVKGRAWFAESADMEYSQTVVEDIRTGNNRTPSLRLNNLLHTQVNLTPSNLLFASFLVNTWNAPGWGLSALDPPSSTINRRSRNWFFSVKDQAYLAAGTLVEFGYAETRTFARQIPQGGDPYVIAPYGRQGNYFVDSTQTASRKQWLANLFLPAAQRWGEHRIKAGIDVDRSRYRQSARRTAVDYYGLAGNLIRRMSFQGGAGFGLSQTEASWYVVDTWRPAPGLVIDLGARQDWDELIHRTAFSPRASFAWAPFRAKNTKIAGGFAVVCDATPLELFTQSLDQAQVNTSFNADRSIRRGPFLTIFRVANPELRLPRYVNWTLGMEQRLPRNIALGIQGMRKRSSSGYTYLNTLTAPVGNVEARFDLFNERRDVYDSVEVTARQALRGEYEWMASYTRSRALSNAVMNIGVDSTTQVKNNVGPMPWDTPSRLLAWGYLPTKWRNWAVAAMLEYRNGFPFSIQRDDGTIEGEVNSYRLPAYFSLDLHVERRLTVMKYRVALRGGFSNITNHRNPTVVNNVIGAPQFMQYFGSNGRHLLFRLRWLGRGGF